MMRRLAWFSPMPPVRTGVAVCSADLISALAREYAIDVYVHEPAVTDASTSQASFLPPRTSSAHDFVWRHRQTPYDLTIYQLGNSSHHDYMWPYLFRFPGLTVLHDVHLHHARAAALLRTKRAADYRAEFTAAEPDASPDTAELAIAGFDNHLYYMWPMTRLAVLASRMVAVHTRAGAEQLRAQVPAAAIEAIHLGHGVPVDPETAQNARQRVLGRHGIAADAVVFGCFGGLTPDKRIPQVLDAFSALLPYAPHARLILAGAPAAHYDVAADVAARGLHAHAVLTGYLETEADLTEYIAACDVTLNLRWPTAREVSGPWLRCLAAGKATVVIDLAHMDVPSLDPRTWVPNLTSSEPPTPVCVAIDILDEDHSLRLAMRRLAHDAGLRASLGRAAAEWWQREHTPEQMVNDYRRIIPRAIGAAAPRPGLPAHLVDNGGQVLRTLLQPFGVENPLERARPVTAPD